MVRAVLSEAANLGAATTMFDGPALAALPFYAPEASGRSPEQRRVLEALRAADGVVIGSPAYHGGVSGLIKNALDLTEDLRDEDRSYFDGRPVGLAVVAAGWQSCGVTLQALRGIVHALRGWPTPLGISVNTVAQQLFGDSGEVVDVELKRACQLQAAQLMSFAAAMRAKPDAGRNATKPLLTKSV